MRKYAVVVTASVLLSACGSEKSGEITTADGETAQYTVENDGEGTTATVTTDEGTVVARSGAGTKADLPEGFTLYPGANVISTTNVSSDGQSGNMTMFESADSPEKVAAFYRKQAEAAGFEIKSETKAEGAFILTGEGPGKSGFMINANTSGDKTVAQLMVGKDGAE